MNFWRINFFFTFDGNRLTVSSCFKSFKPKYILDLSMYWTHRDENGIHLVI